MVPEEQLLSEIAQLAGKINQHKRTEKQKQKAEEARILEQMAQLSGMINKRKRGEPMEGNVEGKSPKETGKSGHERALLQTSSTGKRLKEGKQELCVFFVKYGMKA